MNDYTDFDTTFRERHALLIVVTLLVGSALYLAWPVTTIFERLTASLPR